MLEERKKTYANIYTEEIFMVKKFFVLIFN